MRSFSKLSNSWLLSIRTACQQYKCGAIWFVYISVYVSTLDDAYVYLSVCVRTYGHNCLCGPRKRSLLLRNITQIWGISAISTADLLMRLLMYFIFCHVFVMFVLLLNWKCTKMSLFTVWGVLLSMVQMIVMIFSGYVTWNTQFNNNPINEIKYLFVPSLFFFSTSFCLSDFRPMSGIKMTSACLPRWSMARWRRWRRFSPRKASAPWSWTARANQRKCFYRYVKKWKTENKLTTKQKLLCSAINWQRWDWIDCTGFFWINNQWDGSRSFKHKRKKVKMSQDL